jgi:hypothetical protein
MKLKFIDSSSDEKRKTKNIVETTVTERMIFEFQELLINAKVRMSLNLMKKMMMKRD